MDNPLQIHFHGVDPSDAIRAYVRARAATLDDVFPHVIGCRVAIEAADGHKHHGGNYRVRIDVTVPGHELVVSRNPTASDSHVDAYAAIDDAFDDITGVLTEQGERLRGEIKSHEAGRRRGHVKKLFSADGYGFLADEDGEDVYFHQNSVRAGAFARLKIGSRVHFAEEMGDKGRQASLVVVLRS